MILQDGFRGLYPGSVGFILAHEYLCSYGVLLALEKGAGN